MTDPEILAKLETTQIVAALLVAIGVALEFATAFIARPIQHRVELARSSEIAQANARAAEANQKAEAERLARVKIEQRLAPRLLDPEQVDALVQLLKRHAATAMIIHFGDTPEIIRFSGQLADAARQAGWRVAEFGAMGGANFTGILISHARNARALNEVPASLAAVLTQAGFEAAVYPAFDPADGNSLPAMVGPTGAFSAQESTIRVFVGAK